MRKRVIAVLLMVATVAWVFYMSWISHEDPWSKSQASLAAVFAMLLLFYSMLLFASGKPDKAVFHEAVLDESDVDPPKPQYTGPMQIQFADLLENLSSYHNERITALHGKVLHTEIVSDEDDDDERYRVVIVSDPASGNGATQDDMRKIVLLYATADEDILVGDIIHRATGRVVLDSDRGVSFAYFDVGDVSPVRRKLPWSFDTLIEAFCSSRGLVRNYDNLDRTDLGRTASTTAPQPEE